jgi:hypothetical protein
MPWSWSPTDTRPSNSRPKETSDHPPRVVTRLIHYWVAVRGFTELRSGHPSPGVAPLIPKPPLSFSQPRFFATWRIERLCATFNAEGDGGTRLACGVGPWFLLPPPRRPISSGEQEDGPDHGPPQQRSDRPRPDKRCAFGHHLGGNSGVLAFPIHQGYPWAFRTRHLPLCRGWRLLWICHSR